MLLFTFFEMVLFAIMVSSFHLFMSNTFDSLKEPQVATAVADQVGTRWSKLNLPGLHERLLQHRAWSLLPWDSESNDTLQQELLEYHRLDIYPAIVKKKYFLSYLLLNGPLISL